MEHGEAVKRRSFEVVSSVLETNDRHQGTRYLEID